MTGKEAKTVLQMIVNQMQYTHNKLNKSDETSNTFVRDFYEAVKIACDAIDMIEDRLDIDGGGKLDE